MVGIRGSPFIEGSGPLLLEHGKGAVPSTAILAQGRVHVSRLDHIDRGGDDSGAEARPKGGGEVAREVICQEAAGKDLGLLTYHPRGKRINQLRHPWFSRDRNSIMRT